MLRRELVTPIHSYTVRLITLAAGCAAIGAAVTLFAAPKAFDVNVPATTLASEEVLAPSPMPSVAVESVPDVPVTEINLVFRTGDALYMKLADASGKQKHRPLTLDDKSNDYRVTSVGVVAEHELPRLHRRWIGKSVMVDGTCEAKVTGFAVVARLTGDIGYTGSGDDSEWTTANVYEHGHPVLAAKLEGCEQGTFARDASLASIVVPTQIEDAALAKQARAKLLSSAPSRKAQLEWEQEDHTGTWHEDDTFVAKTIVVKHPTTNVTWVSAHAKLERGCGDIEINLWGLYRVDAQGNLVAVQQRQLGDAFSIDRLIDLEGDGELEYIGQPWIATDVIVSRSSGDEVERLALPFYGCPC